MQADPEKLPRRETRTPKVPGYEIEGILGRGASGTVYRARQVAMDRRVALKVLYAELSQKPNVVRRLQREGRTTARLAHPGVVAAIDMGEADGLWWYAMELVDGSSLAVRLRQEGRLSEREALRLFLPLCEALEHLWEEGVVHRDIKPGNILIDASGRARLADLGLAFHEDDPGLTRQGGTLGTPHYISPEQAVDSRTADVRSDLWSFGATLFHAVCGRPPFVGDSTAEVLSGVLYGRIVDPLELEPGLSRGLGLVLRKCLTRDPERRYATPGELREDLERVRERRQPKVRRQSLDPVARQADPARTWSLVLVLLVALAAGTWWGVRRLATPEGDTEARASEPVAPSPALVELERRARERPEHLAQHLHELDALRAELPPEQRPSWEALDQELHETLRGIVLDVRREVETAWKEQVEARDYAAAAATLREGFGRRLLLRTGFQSPEALDAARVPISSWIASQREAFDSSLERVLDELEKGLAAWRTRTLAEVDRRVSDMDWNGAGELLLVDDATMLAGAGFADYRLPPEPVELRLADLRLELRSLRYSRLVDDWVVLDSSLVADVHARADVLREELEAGPPRIRAAEELRKYFERLLRDRRLTLEKMLGGVKRGAVEVFEREVADLREREDRLNERDFLGDVDETSALADQHLRRREYEAADGMWQTLRHRLEALPEEVDGAWRDQAGEELELHALEAELLQELLQRAALRLVELDGRPFDLYVGSILYAGRVLRVGPSPLEEGFHLEGLRRPLDLRTIRASDFLRIAELDEEDPKDRLVEALFLLHEAEPEEARRVLRGGALPREGRLEELSLGVGVRVTDALEARARTQHEREAAAAFYLEGLTEERIAESPGGVLQWVETLLEEFSDVPEVRARRDELLALRKRLRQHERGEPAAGFEEVYGADHVRMLPLDGVELDFLFEDGEVGAWTPGDWVFDGRGWSLPGYAVDWNSLAVQNGPQLVLRPPLDLDTGTVEVEFRIARDPRADPHQLVVFYLAGFQAAFTGSGLPGGDGQPRWLCDTGDPGRFLARVRAGEGRPVAELFSKKDEHRVRLEVNRRSGYYSLYLDDSLLGREQPEPPDRGARGIQIRSWDQVRLLEVRVTGRRG